ncbi:MULTISPECIES: hypothetical protein [Streptosporangium]|uniref:Uncharacterized protein n=1 Tax=Streptosporangium brasiliense TaxID=47480 RepID=A0ABT9R352_9ACTN|nr:hypothetical protein [Streptosporangium brasiliense]MDP9863666.1 hypothetical protein [Streptosporangium brasiliense]
MEPEEHGRGAADVLGGADAGGVRIAVVGSGGGVRITVVGSGGGVRITVVGSGGGEFHAARAPADR